jgi:hypothetical protein
MAQTRTPLFARRQPGGVFTIVDIEEHPGSVFFVDSTHTAAANAAGGGQGPDTPLATIDYAIGLCTANKGDIIYVMPGHAETVAGAAGINCDVAGVTIIGIGKGAYRPTITMSAVASTIAIAAASVHLKNFLIKVEHDCTVVVDVNAADCTLEELEIRSRVAATAREFVTAIDINGGGANACDRTVIRKCLITSPAAGANNAIELGEVADGVVIEDCVIIGDFGDAAIHNPTGKILTHLRVQRCTLRNLQTGDHALELVSACTGILQDNRYYTDLTQQTGVDPGSCFSTECYQADAIDTSGIITPILT